MRVKKSHSLSYCSRVFPGSALDGGPGGEDAFRHRGVVGRHVLVEHLAPVAHRHSGHGDVVLDGDRLARQFAVRDIGVLDVAAPRPRVELVLLRLWGLAFVALGGNSIEQILACVGLKNGLRFRFDSEKCLNNPFLNNFLL